MPRPGSKPRRKIRRSANYVGLKPASALASSKARSSSLKTGTRCELLLVNAVRALGFRPALNVDALPGKPDLVFRRAKLVVFCDGDFWHGRRFIARKRRLSKGHNAPYWVAKIAGNIARDRRNNAQLKEAGWRIFRFWESEITANVDAVAKAVAKELR